MKPQKYFYKLNILLLLMLINISNVLAETIEKNKPNIILIVADDLGYGDVSFNGSLDIKTPNIDRIAKDGVIFTRGYVTHSICAPSRAGILTGKYQQRFGFEVNPGAIPNKSGGIPNNEFNLAEVLNSSGYKTAAIGKWHLGAGSNYSANQRGFDYFFGFERGVSNYYPELLTLDSYSEVTERYGWYKMRLLENEKPVEINSYLTDALSSSAVEFIERSKKDPFFLYLAFNAPHSPMQADQVVYDGINDIKDPSRRTYAAMVKSLDNGIGNVLDKLTELNLEDNTMIIFLSDNGGPEKTNFSDNGKLRGGKASPYEGGIRVPMAIKWPKVYPKGLIFNKNVSSLDFFATIIEATNTDYSDKEKLDGVNLTPCLVSSKCKALDRFLYFRDIDKGWKVVLSPHSVKIVTQPNKSILKFSKEKKESFNLLQDISEKHPNHDNHKDNYNNMIKKYYSWEKKLPGPAFSNQLSQFPDPTFFFRLKRKIKYIYFHTKRDAKFYLGIY